MHEIRKLLQVNTCTVESYLVVGDLGHLGLIASVAVHTVVSNNAWANPGDPGHGPTIDAKKQLNTSLQRRAASLRVITTPSNSQQSIPSFDKANHHCILHNVP
jgi:hypothetical protein